jgi:hypothetical protein
MSFNGKPLKFGNSPGRLQKYKNGFKKLGSYEVFEHCTGANF